MPLAPTGRWESRRARSVAVAVLTVLVAVLALWLGDGSSTEVARDGSPSGQAPAAESASGPGGGDVDPVSGLARVEERDLPVEARETLRLLERGGPFPYAKDGSTFGNRERLLPAGPAGYYREYTVRTPGSDDRGARRIVTGDGGERYWTEDHYDSFERIVRETG